MDKLTYPIMLTDENDAGLNIVITSEEKLKQAITYFYGGDDVSISRHYDGGNSMVKVKVLPLAGSGGISSGSKKI